LRGFDIIGAFFVGSQNWKEDANRAIEASHKLRSFLYDDKASHSMVVAFSNTESSEIQFFVSANSTVAEVESVVYEDNPEIILWNKGCLTRCQLALKLPIYAPLHEKFGNVSCSFRINFCWGIKFGIGGGTVMYPLVGQNNILTLFLVVPSLGIKIKIYKKMMRE
jgi:hypothetical protein